MNSVARFATFELDLRTRELRNRGIRMHLRRQSADILAMLLDRPGEVVTREEIRSKLWPDGTIVEFEHSVNSAVNRLREVLGDSSDRPRYIETVPRLGYRFVGGVETVGPQNSNAPSPPEPALQPLAAKPAVVRRLLWVAALVGILAAGTALTFRKLILPRAEALPPIRSIAVLPLVNLSQDADQEYFSDGMTEVLTSNLAKLGGLRVISRTSSMSFKGTHKPLKEIAKALGVDAVVEGSVLVSAGRIRISAQLIEAANDTHLWSETYERDLQDVLHLQSEVALAVVREIKVAVTPDEQRRLSSVRKIKPEAYETYLKAMFFVNKFTPEGFDKGLAYLQQAVDKDPSDPFAYAALGLGYAIIGHERFPDALPRGKAAARRSLELGGPVPEAYLALAMAELYADWDYTAAGRDLRRVLEISPNLAEARRHYSWYLLLLGKRNEALDEMKRASELEPIAPLFAAEYSWQLLQAGQNDKALEQARKSLEVDPQFAPGLVSAGFAYLAKGMNEQALEVHRKAAEADAEWRWPLAETYAHLGQKNQARKIAAEIAKKAGPMDLWALGRVYTALGDKDQALHWLEAAYQSRFSWMPWTVNDTAFGFAPLFGDPRFKDLARRVGTPTGL